MKTANKKLSFETKECLQFIDITDEVKSFLKESDFQNGLINIQSLHTTCAVLLNENEPLLIQDIKDNLERLASIKNEYRHDNFKIRTVNMCDDECANGHSHCKAVYLPPSISLNVIDGEIQLGTWQRIFFVELDRPRKRNVQIQIIGE